MATSPAWLSSESRARQVLDHLARHGSATVKDLVDALGVTTTAVRQHVNHLLEDGWVFRTQQRRPAGRPADVFTLSRKASRLFGNRAEELSKVLVQAIIAELGPTKGRELLRAAGRRLAQDALQAVEGQTVGQRLRELARRLADAGDLVETQRENGHLKLSVYTCPYGGTPGEHSEICELERQSFSEVVGRPLKLLPRDAVTAHRCVFTPAAESNDNGQSTDSEQV